MRAAGSRLLLAGFDPQVQQIYAQPFRLAARVSGRVRHQVPDFLLVTTAGTARLVNVKPQSPSASSHGAGTRRPRWPAA